MLGVRLTTVASVGERLLGILPEIVTHKFGDMEPGFGFYEMARTLGYRFSEPYVFWAQQVQEVFKMHGRPERRHPRA